MPALPRSTEKVLVPVDDTRAIEFSSQEDYFIYLAQTGNYSRLADAYELLTRRRLDTKQYRYFQAQGQRLKQVLSDTRLTDGTSLMEFVRGKINL